MLRLFFALQPTQEQNAALAAQVAPLIAQLGAQPARAENLHATLCFIGAIEPARLDALRAAAATLRGRPVRLFFDALEYWETPKILCATASRDSSSASELSIALGEAAVRSPGSECRVVKENCAGADDDRVGRGAPTMHVGPGGLAGDPLAAAVGGGAAAVHTGGDLPCDVR